MLYNFDEIIDRKNTDTVKYELRNQIFNKPDVLPMWVADMDFKTPYFILQAIRKRAEHEILGYTLRSENFEQSIINWLKMRHNWHVQKKEIAFAPGVVPGLAMAILAFTQAGDKIIIQTPVYHPFHSTVKDLGRQLIENELIETDGFYEIDFEKLEKQIDKRTKMLILSNPHNPVGRVWKEDELRKLGEICLKHHILIVSDDIHSDLVFRPHVYTPIASLSEELAMQTISFFAPSKTFNLAGLNTSFAIISNSELFSKYAVWLENLHLFNGNIFGNIALESAYTNGEKWLIQLLDYLQENIDFVDSFLKKNLPKIKIRKPEGTYLAWLDFRAYQLTQNELNKRLIHQAGLGFNSGEMFGNSGNGFQRINLACSRFVVEDAMEKLRKFENV